DIGKIGVPDAILLKPGKLTPEEFGIMQQHTIYAGRILEDSESSIIQLGRAIALSHHEKWNGTGYPNQLKGDAIPISGQIVAVADVFDALVSRRCYKDPIQVSEAFTIIEKDTGSHFSPKIGAAFLDI